MGSAMSFEPEQHGKHLQNARNPVFVVAAG